MIIFIIIIINIFLSSFLFERKMGEQILQTWFILVVLFQVSQYAMGSNLLESSEMVVILILTRWSLTTNKMRWLNWFRSGLDVLTRTMSFTNAGSF